MVWQAGFAHIFNDSLMPLLKQVPRWEPVIRNFVCATKFNDLPDSEL
jgi:hypothetical protein